MTTNKIDDTQTALVQKYEVANFETAIVAAGFGKFNYILLSVALIAVLSNSFATTTISYVVPVAQCDLSLTLVDKGVLNACYYLGTLSSVFLWGFLADTFGRRKLQILGYWFDTVCNIGCVLSQSFWMLFIFKYFSGFVGSGPYTILMSYISEFHSTKYRSRVMVLAGVFLSAGNAIIPFIAWWIFPMDISFQIFSLKINSWRIFLAVCSLPSLFAAIGHIFLPESPKFLMSISKNEQALKVFRNIYKMNTGRAPHLYPVKLLADENRVEESVKNELIKNGPSSQRTFRSGLRQMKAMFFPPFLLNFVIVNSLQFGGTMGMNSLRLWLPQLFTTIDEFNKIHNHTSNAPLCDMLQYKPNNNFVSNHRNVSSTLCIVPQLDDQVYINSIIVSVCALVGYAFVTILINAIGKKNLLILTFALGGVTGIANYWSTSSLTTLAYSSTCVTMGGICVQIVIAVTVELFPTSLRTMVISTTMITSRIGGMLGSVLFPMLLEKGCLPPFLLIGGITIVCSAVSFLLPKNAPEFK